MTPDLRQEHDRQDASQAQELTRTPGGKNKTCGKSYRRQEQDIPFEWRLSRTCSISVTKLDDEWPESIFHHVGSQSASYLLSVL